MIRYRLLHTPYIQRMKKIIACILLISVVYSCTSRTEKQKSTETLPIIGTWQLLSGTLIEKGDTVITDYTKDRSFIKIINATHFSFTQHDLNKGQGADASFSAGAGTYTLTDSTYTEHLTYCSDRAWEGHDFSFTLTLQNDTLTQRGIEIVEATGVNRLNIEKYVRVKN